MLLPPAVSPSTRRDGGRRAYDPLQARAVVAALYAAGTAVGLAVQVLPRWETTGRGPIGAATVGTTVCALAVGRLRNLPYAAAGCLTAAGCVVIGYIQWAAGPGAPAAAFGALYGLALSAAFLFYRTRLLLLQIALACCAESAALLALGEARTLAITVAVTVGAGVGTGVVVRRLDDLRLHAEQELAWRAAHDGLTGLANRTALTREWHALPAGPGTAVSVLVLDLRGFKQVNDLLGHGCGDEVLVQVGARLATLGPPALPCRLGGDEFAVLLPGAGAAAAVERAHAVSALLHESYEVDGVPVPLGATVGVATRVWPDADRAGTPAVDRAAALSGLLADADRAMYHAREVRRRVAVAGEVPAGSVRRRG